MTNDNQKVTSQSPISGQMVEFAAGATLFVEGDVGDRLYIIRTGQTKVFKVKSDGTEIPLAIVGPGQLLGELAVLDGGKRSAHAQTMTKVEALAIDRTAIQATLNTLPPWFMGITRTLVGRIRSLDEMLERNTVIDEKLRSQLLGIEFNGLMGD